MFYKFITKRASVTSKNYSDKWSTFLKVFFHPYMDILKNLVSKLHNFMLQIEEFVNLFKIFKILRVQVHQKKIHIQIRKKKW